MCHTWTPVPPPMPNIAVSTGITKTTRDLSYNDYFHVTTSQSQKRLWLLPVCPVPLEDGDKWQMLLWSLSGVHVTVVPIGGPPGTWGAGQGWPCCHTSGDRRQHLPLLTAPFLGRWYSGSTAYLQLPSSRGCVGCTARPLSPCFLPLLLRCTPQKTGVIQFCATPSG